ncbi:MAG: substrate-binding domain-containing protein [Kineosporiaceae bacterium]
MRKPFLGVLALVAASSLTLSACGDDEATPGASSSGASGGGTIGVILPDSASSNRWETADRKYLTEAITAAGFTPDIQNAGNDKAKFSTIAEGMISKGVKALMIVNLDSETGAAVITKAKNAAIPVIDYDRLTLGGGASYYVSFDNVKVGAAIGDGLVTCLKEKGKTSGGVVLLNGSPTDNNATLFKQGYEKSVKDAGYSIVDDQSVPDWDNTKAGQIFEQIFTKQQGKFVGVASANDGLGGAVVSVLERNGLAGQIPTTGQDATDEGLQRVLLGTQCMTVYKAVKKEADAAAALAIALAKGDTAAADALATGSVTDTKTSASVKSVLLEPQAIFKANVKDVIADGYTTADKVCTTDALKKACTDNGVS